MNSQILKILTRRHARLPLKHLTKMFGVIKATTGANLSYVCFSVFKVLCSLEYKVICDKLYHRHTCKFFYLTVQGRLAHA